MQTLASAISEYGTLAYLLTSAPDGPHTSHVIVRQDGAILRFALDGTGRRNAEENANVSLLWPPRDSGGYSIIVNGVLELEAENSAKVTVSKSVFHRPGQSTREDSPCRSDCLPLEAS